MLTPEEVVWLFKCILGRVPDEQTVSAFCKCHNDFGSLRDNLLYSEEFYLFMKDRLSDFSASYIACDFPPRSYKPDLQLSTLALACIAKNEAATIGRMISSCLPMVDLIGVVDTGSDDATIRVAEVAAEATPLYIDRKDFKDFSTARNQALDLVLGKTDWVLMLDADEFLVPEDFAALSSLISNSYGVDGWRLPRFNFLEPTGIQQCYLYPDYQKRLFKNTAAVRYEGRVHEWVTGVGKWGFAPQTEALAGGSCGGPHIHHTALINPSPSRAVAKYEMYQKLSLDG